MLGVFSCRFTRRDCPHATLFHDSYQRVNRTRQNKILRCFPHCCHGHTQRSYCGASLHVQIDFDEWPPASSGATPSASSPPLRVRQPLVDDDVLVFARFRPAHQPSQVALGARLAPHTVLSSLQSDANPAGEWIEGWLLASAHQSAWLFEVNRSARWHYGWGSSAATTARTTAHVLEVVVFVLRAEAAGAPPQLEVVATTLSPPFRIASFRRRGPPSPPSAQDATIDLPSSPTDGPPVPSSSSPLPSPHQNSDFAVVLAAAAAAIPTASETSDQLTQRWDGVFEHSVLGHPPRVATLESPNDGLAAAVVDVAMWLALDAQIRSDWQRAIAHAAAHVASRPRLLNAHSDWLAALRVGVDSRLAATSPQWPSLASLAQAVKILAPNITHDMDDTVVPLSFASFVANVRQAAVAQNALKTRRPGRPVRPVPSVDAETPWWFCPLDHMRVWPLVTAAASTAAEPPVVPLVTWFYRQLACIAIVESPEDADTATLFSAAGVDNASGGRPQVSPFVLPAAGATLVLDGRPRWTATLPNGDATLGTTFGGDWVLGDYVARRASGVLRTEWLAWQVRRPQNSGEGAVCVASRRVRFELSSHNNEDDATDLLAVATVEHGAFVDGDETAFDDAENCEQRLRRVSAWAPRWRVELHYCKVNL